MFLTNSRTTRAGRHGFTLTELLVALTISVAVLGAVFVAFNASNRAIRQGYMIIRGFDLARSTFDIIESDLTTAFAQRELGDNHKFFGTPIGFTYVATANPATGAGAADTPQIARVTYVVYYGDPLDPFSGRRGSGSVVIQEAFDGLNPDEATGTSFYLGQELITYSLLRFVEPGVGDLDSWPSVNGANLWDVLAGGSEVTNQTIANYLAEPIANASPDFDYAYGAPDTLNANLRGSPPTAEQLELQNARKRELWIRMLSGDPELPNLWQILGRNPRDFVVAENIFLPANIIPRIPVFTDERFVFFRYGVSQRNPMFVSQDPETGLFVIDPGGAPVLDGEHLASTGDFRIRDGMPDERWHLYWASAYNLLYDEGEEDPRNFGRIADNAPNSPDSSLWLEFEKVFGSADVARDLGVTLDQLAFDPTILFAATGLAGTIANPYNANSVPGTPYDSQLPEQVHVRFEYLLASPWAGVAEFRREFDQVVDVPAGYTRKPPPTVAGL